MLKKIFTVGKNVVKKRFNVRQWSNYEGVQDSASWCKDLLARVFTVEEPAHIETFEQALVRLHLTEAMVQQRKKYFSRLAWMYVACFFGLLFYGHLYLYPESPHFYVLLADYCVSLLVLTQAFRYSYWCSQISQRHLGISVGMWFKWLLGLK